MFRKSSFSGDTNCVEVDRDTPGKVKVRDSKSRATLLTFTTTEWRAFILGAKRHEFDACPSAQRSAASPPQSGTHRRGGVTLMVASAGVTPPARPQG